MMNRSKSSTRNFIKEKENMSEWECQVCGYIYDEEQGDPENGIDPGTKFEDLADDWVCPVCGASKDQFKKL
jgi:rubredoxin